MSKSKTNIILIALIFGAIAGAAASYAFLNFQETSQEELIKDFYATEVAVHVSPHHLRKAMTNGDDSFILVDLRSQEEYEREHILGAINIPAYKTPEKSAYGDVERIVGAFAALPKDKEIIVYCYSIPCMTGRKIGNMLADHDIYVQQLGVGWNEWRYFWELWNHEHEWDQVSVEDYVKSGIESQPLEEKSTACNASGEFGC
jgi:hypothetical protein